VFPTTVVAVQQGDEPLGTASLFWLVQTSENTFDVRLKAVKLNPLGVFLQKTMQPSNSGAFRLPATG
jgi:hypothetical protein